ncbi:MAG TPA: LysR family transcriptional regulator [Candidatus Acidoferrales bacterium]|nr:LysR family transcriptional regulator [Candidatus Acidoferrales bacterium]
MELRQIEIFKMLAEELNFTRTGRRIHCVQSNVSVQIRSLEREFGVQLFERLGQRVRLTAQGQTFLPYAERILRLVQEATAVTRGGENPAGTLIIGMPESVLTYRLPPVLQIFRGNWPHVELVFRGISSIELIPCLERGDLDLGLVIDDAIRSPGIHAEVLCNEALALTVQPGHPLLRAPIVRPEDLGSYTFLLTDQGCAYRSKLETALAHVHVRPRTVMEFTSVEAIKQCAALGMGIACLPRIVVERDLASGKLVVLPTADFELVMHTLVVWHRDKWLSPAMKAFLSLIRSHLGSTSISNASATSPATTVAKLTRGAAGKNCEAGRISGRAHRRAVS